MWRSLFGTVVIQMTSADTHGMMTRLANDDIHILELRYVDALTVQFSASRSDYRRICLLLRKSGAKIKVIGRSGVYWRLKSLHNRPVLSIGVTIYILLVLVVPSHILFVQVDGNASIPDRMILEAAEGCGITFGVNRRQVRSERIKNAMLEKLPQLQWVGVNTRGCVAVISVKERQDTMVYPPSLKGNIVASQDAIIQGITVLRGTQLCKVGQAVKAGQMLVSGYKDYGISLKFTGADAEIYGLTERKLDTVTPKIGIQRTDIVRREQKYSLIIGKKQINFYKGSGILHMSCVKMYKKTYLALPGGYTLPLAIVKQEILYYDSTPGKLNDFAFLEIVGRTYLKSQMTAGTILTEAVSLTENDDICLISGRYECMEMIGITKAEELIDP
ncbi:MAG: hypothetical protein E7453_04605 [Ruminococcaceae bacterium]|nr:hypothetical protein [Oscillospiraceae bacterium]